MRGVRDEGPGDVLFLRGMRHQLAAKHCSIL